MHLLVTGMLTKGSAGTTLFRPDPKSVGRRRTQVVNNAAARATTGRESTYQ